MKEFTPSHLPKEWRDKYREIMGLALHTVRIRVKYPRVQGDEGAQDGGTALPVTMKYGSGWMGDNTVSDLSVMTCPLDPCPVSHTPHQVLGPIEIMTAAHVIENQEEVTSTEVDFFLDDWEDKSSVLVAHGVRMHHWDKDVDIVRREATSAFFTKVDTLLIYCVTHDLDFVKKYAERRKALALLLQSHMTDSLSTEDSDTEDSDTEQEPCQGATGGAAIESVNRSTSSFAVCVSHPHGSSKHISVGTVHKVKTRDDVSRSEAIMEAWYAAYTRVKDKTGPNAPPYTDTTGQHTDHTEDDQGHLLKKLKESQTELDQFVMNIIEKFRIAKTDAEWLPLTPDVMLLKKIDRSTFASVATQICRDSGAVLPDDERLLLGTEYTVPTCPGSSGSSVRCWYEHQGQQMQSGHTHSGSRTGTGINVAGIGASFKL